jgi:hypothetical protein
VRRGDVRAGLARLATQRVTLVLGVAVATGVPTAVAAWCGNGGGAVPDRSDAQLVTILPLPPGARRLLIAALPGQPYTVTMFQDASTPPHESLRRHRLTLQRSGFHVREPSAQLRAAHPPGHHALLVQRGQVWAVVVVTPARSDPGTITTVAATRDSPARSPLPGRSP